MNQKNSFVSLAERLSAMNKNSVEIISKMSDIVSAEDSAVSISLIDNEGNKTNYYMPTVGYLKKEIDRINTNIKRLAGIDTSSTIIDGQNVKKIFVSNLNKEPFPITSLGEIKNFEPINNHFFETLMNPILSVEVDLTDKITNDIKKVLSRRYIVKFERNADFSLTEDGLSSYNSYQSTFANRTMIDINEFIAWYEQELNVGILRDTVDPYDEQIFDLSVNEVTHHGLFSVIKTETDTLNNKFWYHLNTLTYYTSDGFDVSLSVGDNLIINRLNSSSRWVIKEVNTESSNYRVRMERVEGYDPVPIGTNVLRYYSDVNYQKIVKVGVGFDEFCVLFIKPINDDSNVISTTWSKGVSFYTNDLILSTDNNTDLSRYYLSSVYDYGKLLKDMILKKIPSEYAETPLSPVLTTDNFKVVQINKHLTDTENTRTLRNLHSQKITSKSKISQINNAIVQKNKELNTSSYTTIAEYNAVKNELKKLIDDQERETKTLSSTISQLNTKKTENQEGAKFRVRGFWNIPAPIYNGKTEPQHVVQFRIQYRYSAKSGEINTTEGYKISPATNSEIPGDNGRVVIQISQTTTGTVAPIIKGNITTSSINSAETTSKEKTGYFSNWNEIITDVRKRYWDKEKGIWYWKVEDVEDADTPNINQLDIPIQPNEKVEVRIKSISEVGWPDSIVESDWSEIITVQFPDDLDNILNENDFILKEATQDETIVGVESTLNSRGVYKHIQDSYYVNETYISHTDKSIQVSFKDSNGNTMDLYNYLNSLTTRIRSLEEEISKAKGEMAVYLIKGGIEIAKLKNGSSTNISVELEDYAVAVSGTTGSRSYYNTVTYMTDYDLEFRNISLSNALGLLSSRNYETGSTNTYYQYTGHKTMILNYNNDLYTQFNNQYIWFSDNSNGSRINNHADATTAYSVLGSDSYNLGTVSGSTDLYTPIYNITSDANWTGGDPDSLFVTVHPRVNNISDLIESGQEKLKTIVGGGNISVSLYALFKLDGNSSNDSVFVVSPLDSPKTRTRKIKVFLEPENMARPFEFELIFKFKQFREVLYQTQFEQTAVA